MGVIKTARDRNLTHRKFPVSALTSTIKLPGRFTRAMEYFLINLFGRLTRRSQRPQFRRDETKNNFWVR